MTQDAVIAMGGLAKLFVGDVVERARSVYHEATGKTTSDPTGEKGADADGSTAASKSEAPLRPHELRDAALDVLKRDGLAC